MQSVGEYLDVHNQKWWELGVCFDLWKVEVLSNVMNLLGAGKQVNTYWIISSIVWSCTFLLISEKIEIRGSVCTAHAHAYRLAYLMALFVNFLAYFRNVSLLNLKRDGSIRDQHPVVGFSPPYGIVCPTFGRTTYFLDLPTMRLCTLACWEDHQTETDTGLTAFTTVFIIITWCCLVWEPDDCGFLFCRAATCQLLHPVIEADRVQQLA